MKRIRHTTRFVALILIGVFLVSCATGAETPAPGTPQSPTATGAPATEMTPLQPSTETPSATLGVTATAVAADGAENEPRYALDWKIGDEEVVAYRTAMNPAGNAGSSISFDLDQLLAEDDVPDQLRQQLPELRFPDTFSMISILERNARDNITVRMIVDEVETGQDEPGDELSQGINELMGAMAGTVQLRGELTPEGAIASFYLEQEQRNLLAMFFELPPEPVAVGDSWAIDVNCIAMGNGFIAANAERVNRVEFTEVTKNAAGEPIAVLDYVIVETVAGDFQMPFSDEAVPTTMTCTFFGQGQFLIEQGRWQQLTAEMAIKATGLMNADNVQLFALSPLAAVPQAYKDVE